MSKIKPVYSTQAILDFTGEMTRKAIGAFGSIDGCLIECGVAAGSQLAKMAEANMLEDQEYWRRRKIYGFDSFEGIPYGTEKDEGSQPGKEKGWLLCEIAKGNRGKLQGTGVAAHSMSDVRKNFHTWGVSMDNVRLIKGWFENTVPVAATKFAMDGERIALLRLDGDLYRSTKVCLEHFLPLVSAGGVVIIDDWKLKGCRKATLEYLAEAEIQEKHGIAYWIKK